MLVVVGIASIIKPVRVDNRIIQKHMPISLIAIILLLFLANINSNGEYSIVNRWQGIILIIFAIGYIIYTIYEENKFKNDEYDKELIDDVKSQKNLSMITSVVYIVIGILGLKYGSDFVVDNAVTIAEKMGLSEKFIGATIIAIGTTLPEIITGIVAARRDASDLLLGNIIGSNIFNLCLLAGLGSVINPLIYEVSFNSSLLFLATITLLLQLRVASNEDNKIHKKSGIIMIVVYVFYVIFMLN